VIRLGLPAPAPRRCAGLANPRPTQDQIFTAAENPQIPCVFPLFCGHKPPANVALRHSFSGKDISLRTLWLQPLALLLLT
jgi:hypothetical protein